MKGTKVLKLGKESHFGFRPIFGRVFDVLEHSVSRLQFILSLAVLSGGLDSPLHADVDVTCHLLHLQEPSGSIDPRQTVCISWIDVENSLLDVLLITEANFSLCIHVILHCRIKNGEALNIPKRILQYRNRNLP